MECATCGQPLKENARFCGNCGTQIMATPTADQRPGAPTANQPLTYDDLLRYNEMTRAQQAFDESLKDAQRYVTYATNTYESLRGTFWACTVIGLVIVAFFASQALPVMFSQSLAVGLFSAIVALPVFFALPFGAIPIKNWFVDHGFFIVASLLFIVLFIYIFLMIALLIGIPYFFHFRNKVRHAKQDLADAEARLQQLTATA